MLDKQSDYFEEKLKIGIAGEDIVYDYLVANNSFVEDLRNQKHDEHSGPKLKGTEGELVLPDFAVYNKNTNKGNFAVEVKVKNSLYTYLGCKCFTVDNKYSQYCRAVEVKKLDSLKIIFIYNDRLYLYNGAEYHSTTIFDNKYGKGLVYLFEHDEKKIVF